MNVYIWTTTPPYAEESIVYKMNADSSGNLYVPTSGLNTSGAYGVSYNWKISVDGGTEDTYSGTGSNTGRITLSGYTAGSNHKIEIKPVTEGYGWARAFAFGLASSVGNSLITEILYDGSFMGYATSATTCGDYFRENQYYNCTSLTYSPEESLPDDVTNVGSYFRCNQYYGCTSLTEIKGWKDIRSGSNYRMNQYYGCTSNKTMKVLNGVYNVGAYNTNAIDVSKLTSVSVPNDYLDLFKSSSKFPWRDIDDSKFIGY